MLHNVPVIILIGKYEYTILLNVIFNIGLMFTAAVGNILIIFSFMLVSSMRTTSNYVLFELALTDLCVGLIVHPLYILALYRVYKKKFLIVKSWLPTAYRRHFLLVSLCYILHLLGLFGILVIQSFDRFLQIKTNQLGKGSYFILRSEKSEVRE